MTLKELRALAKRYEMNHDWLNYRAALICAVLANTWRGKNVKVFSPDDFMPGGKSGQVKSQTPEQILAAVRMLNAAYGGSVMEK